MAGVDNLPPDQRAVLQLVIVQGRTYEDLAGLLGIDAVAVRARAHAAADILGGAEGDRLAAERRGEITDFLLGQQSVSQREATRAHLTESGGARDWAHGVSDELSALGGEELPEIPSAAGPPGFDEDPAE